ncbi:MAG: hypothetical protein V7606_2486 [Burkholderiales bacterium]
MFNPNIHTQIKASRCAEGECWDYIPTYVRRILRFAVYAGANFRGCDVPRLMSGIRIVTETNDRD